MSMRVRLRCLHKGSGKTVASMACMQHVGLELRVKRIKQVSERWGHSA